MNLDPNEKNPKAELITHLLQNGKDQSWDELAKRFDLKTGECARHAWREYRRTSGTASAYTNTADTVNQLDEISDQIKRFEHNIKTGAAEMTVDVSQEIKSLDELVQKTKIDLNLWQITKWIQNFWNNRYQVKVWLEPKTKEGPVQFQSDFTEFLKTYEPKASVRGSMLAKRNAPSACLVINKQDSHHNKFDILGNNSIEDRFEAIEAAIYQSAKKASISYTLEKIIYVIGSDEFNSEYTNATTKGTPQTNTSTFYESFEAICNHEISVIKTLLSAGIEVEVIYVAGNHDEFVGWHMIKWLQAYFRSEAAVKFDISPFYRKYIAYGSSLMMFNHGDAIKPEKLAGIFPAEAEALWSGRPNKIIFTGDKHHTVTKDINGIMFYQLPSLSNARSTWDDKNGHVCSKAELTTFVIDKNTGISDIYKNAL